MSASGGFWDGYPPDAAVCQRCGSPAIGWAMIGLRRFCFRPTRLCCYKVELFDMVSRDRQLERRNVLADSTPVDSSSS